MIAVLPSSSKTWFCQQVKCTYCFLDRLIVFVELISAWNRRNKLLQASPSTGLFQREKRFYKLAKPNEKMDKVFLRQGNFGKEVLLF